MMIHYTTLRRTRLCTRIPARYRRSSSHQVLVSVVPQQFPFESRTLVLSSTYVCSCLLARSSLRASISPRRPHHAESTYEVPGGHCSMQVLPLFSWKLWPLDHRSHSKRSGSGGGGGGGAQVSEGMHQIQRLGKVQTDRRTDRPVQDVRLLKAVCLES